MNLKTKFRKSFVLLLTFSILGTANACQPNNKSAQANAGNPSLQPTVASSTKADYAAMSVPEIVESLTLQQKAAQMVQGAIYALSAEAMKENCYGSVLSTFGEDYMNAGQWREYIDDYQIAALASQSKIPFIYGNDAVHGVNTCLDSVIFPHNIGIGAAGDEELTYQMGLAVADEAKLTGMLWDFAPCVAVAKDPRWGRTYESYSSEPALVKKLGLSFTKGLIDGGVLPCPKHYLADGNVIFGTGDCSDGSKRLIDRGKAQLSEEEIQELLDIYKALVDAGAKSIMVSFSTLNGVKMHENKKYISLLKNDMGFDGIVLSDWNGIHYITGNMLKDKVINAVNAGVDMLMEDSEYENCMKYIVEAVKEGRITQERVDDAVTRIISVKKEMDLFEDPMLEKQVTKEKELGSDTYRKLAGKLVEKSLVLLKNEKKTLPIKKGMSIYVTGPAANDTGAQCGGWTLTWSGLTDAASKKRHVADATTVLEGLKAIAKEYSLTIVTDAAKASGCDMTLLCVGEQPYAEWEGDTADMDLTGKLGLPENKEAIARAKKLGLPTVTCIVAGRNVLIDQYMDNWDAVVMCYLPGSEAGNIANVLTGKSEFTGTLPMPWYRNVDEIKTDSCMFKAGYGLRYDK